MNTQSVIHTTAGAQLPVVDIRTELAYQRLVARLRRPSPWGRLSHWWQRLVRTTEAQ